MFSKEKLIPFSGGSLQREDEACRPQAPQKAGLLFLAVKFLTKMSKGTSSTQSIHGKKHPMLFVSIHHSCQ